MHFLGLFLLSHSPNEGEKKEEENKDTKGAMKTKRIKGQGKGSEYSTTTTHKSLSAMRFKTCWTTLEGVQQS